MSTDNPAALPPIADEHGAMDQHGEVAQSTFGRLLGRLPNLLSSRPVILFGILLFFYLFIFAGIATLAGHAGAVSTNTQLILGNYTNVSSSVGAGIAAGASLTLIKRQRHSHHLALAAHEAAVQARAFAQETHQLMHLVHSDEAAQLGHVPGQLAAAARPDGTPS